MKTCRKCGVEKSYEEFCKRHVCPDGYDTWCKPCRTAYARLNRAKPENRAKDVARSKKRYLEKPEYYRAYIRKYYEEHKPEIKAQAREWYQENKERGKAKRLEWYLQNKGKPEFKAKVAARMRRYLASKGRETLQHAAHACIREAVRCGVLKKQPCEVCGSVVDIQAHHYNGYAQIHWFDVKWLCHVHHLEAHGRKPHGDARF